MLLRLLFVALICSSFIIPESNDSLVQWNSTRRLNWNDFKAVPPKNSTNAALTSSSILMKFSSDGESLHYEISCHFDQNSSWGRVKNDHILSHEQGHFDIAEIHARKLNQALKAYRYRYPSISKDVNAIYQSVMDDLLQMQTLYDEQTNYSRNFLQQRNWLVKIELYLTDLSSYANYH